MGQKPEEEVTTIGWTVRLEGFVEILIDSFATLNNVNLVSSDDAFCLIEVFRFPENK